MLFRQLFDIVSCTYTYLIAKDYGHEAVIIDPVITKIDYYLKLIKELGLNLVVSIDTHVHADHVTASGLLRQHTDCKIAMSEIAQVENLDIKLTQNQPIACNGIEMTTLLTPGHTDDSICLLMPDRVFTGDTLFIRGTGRTDFQNGSALEQYENIKNQLFTLNDTTLVYPGHDYNGATVSTIAEEKKYNPRLQVTLAEEYQAIMDALNLPTPKLIDVAVPANRKLGLIIAEPA